MSSRTRILESTVLGEVPANGFDGPGQRVLVVDLHFIDRRGYWLSANVQVRRQRTISFMPFSSAGQMIEPAARFNAKKLATLVVPQDAIDLVKAKALANNAPRDGSV
jgi:hypothetical protein